MMGYVACLSIAVFILLSLTYIIYSLDYFNSVNDSLEAELDLIEVAYKQGGVNRIDELAKAREKNTQFARFAFILVDENRQKLVGDLTHWPEYFTWSDGWYSFEMDFVNYSGEMVRYNFVARTRDLDQGHAIMVARVADDIRQNIQLVSATLFWSLVIMSVLGIIGAIIISHLSLGRVEEINQTIRTIMNGNLADRIAVGPREDDFQTLAINLNAMFERIESSMNDVRQVTDNIAHDLRTPLTRVRNKLATLQKTAEDDKKDMVREILIEADGLLSTFSALLRISEVESGSKKSNFAVFDLSKVLLDVTELYEPLAQIKDIHLTTYIDSDIQIFGDKDLMFQTLTNLIDNSIKYTPDQGRIIVKAHQLGLKTRLIIADDGPGVQKNKLSKVFQRFYRVEASRGLQPGNGLGLSMVKAVVELHNGFITLTDSRRYFADRESPGLTVTIDMPAQEVLA